MSSDATDNTMRADFERAMRGDGFEFGDDDLKWFDGDFGPYFDKGARLQTYYDSEMQCRWEGWQAARADTARQVTENAEIVATYEKLHAGKLGMHWLWVVVEQVAAGGDPDQALREYGYTRTDASQWSKPDREPSE